MAISLGSGLLAATFLLGQVQEVPIQAQPRASIFGGYSQPSMQSSRPLFSWLSRDDRPVKTKLQSWFGRKEQQEPPLYRPVIQPATPRTPGVIEATPTSNSSGPVVIPITPTPLETYPRKLPNPQSQNARPQPLPVAAMQAGGKSVQQTTLEVSANGAKSPILPQLSNKIGRDDRFEWITGQLEIEVSGYFLYYATPETVDMFNGRVALHPQQIDMSLFRRGDLVSVRGDLMQRQTPQGRLPVYRASDVQLIERVQ